MPHDANGEILQIGDDVIIRGKVKAIHQSEEYCNCDVELKYPMPPNTEKSTYSAINTRQLEKVYLIPEQPPCDNEHVADGCEQFTP